MREGGYEKGYENCSCFWGEKPGSLLSTALECFPVDSRVHVLDAGCGEGKNAAHLAAKGAKVTAIDLSKKAIINGKSKWGSISNINWCAADIMEHSLRQSEYDIVVAYGLLHCLDSKEEIEFLVGKLKKATKPSGLNVLCAFNGRYQELDAHEGFYPTLLEHKEYLQLYDDWEVIVESDKDLHEEHPHNMIRHTHSMTRIIARKY